MRLALSTSTCLILSTVSIAFVTGCGTNMVPAGPREPALSAGMSGSVHGGSQPINNATVTLYAPATNGYGNAPTAIVSTMTGPTGSFTLPGPYTCPANSGDVYLLARGGDAGSGTNGSIALATLLGPCSGLSTATKVSINEATTVAAAYALAQFATVSATGTGIGTSATNLIGLNNAYATAAKLVNPANGATNAATALPGIVLPSAEVNTLANILGYCVNSNGGSCAALFAAATPAGGIAPKDTFQAALDIALNPTNGMTPLFSLSSSYTPFQPGLSVQPADLALGIKYDGSVLASCAFTNGVAIDQAGNAWVGCGTSVGGGGVTEISPAGTYLTGSSGFTFPPMTSPTGGNGLAIDINGTAWLTSAGGNAVYQILASGVMTQFTAGGTLLGPTGIAIRNGTNQVFVANTGNNPAANGGATDYLGQTVSILNLSGGLVSTSRPTLGYGPTDVVNANGNYVVANFTGDSTGSAVPQLLVFDPVQGATVYAYAPPSAMGALAADAANNLWYLNNGSLMQFTAMGGSGTYSYTPSAVDLTPAVTPVSLLFDGNDRMLIAGTGAGGSGAIAFYDDSANLLYTLSANGTIATTPYDPTGLEIDASGNVWISGAPANGSAYLTEVVGAAGPLAMPRAAAGLANTVGARP